MENATEKSVGCSSYQFANSRQNVETPASFTGGEGEVLKPLGSDAVIKLNTPCCPKCDGPARAVEETMLAWTTLSYGGGNEFEWAGWSETTYDSNEPMRYAGKVLLRCANRHQWKSSFQETT